MKIFLCSCSLFILLLFLYSFLLNKNTDDVPLEQIINDNYIIYDEIIREAWAFHKPIANYPKLFKKYREAFSTVSTPRAIDVFDALKIAIEIDSVEAMFEFSQILVKKGCNYRFFERNGLEKLKDYPAEWLKLTSLIKEVQKNPDKYWNVELKEKMEVLYRRDTDIYCKYINKTEFGNNWTLVTEYQKEVKLPFLRLIKEYGIVGEKQLGIYFRDHNDENYILNQVFPGIIILHIIQSGESARFTKDEIDLYYKQGYLPKNTANYIKRAFPLPSQKEYEKTNEMIRRGAPEDSITIQVRKDWRATRKK